MATDDNLWYVIDILPLIRYRCAPAYGPNLGTFYMLQLPTTKHRVGGEANNIRVAEREWELDCSLIFICHLRFHVIHILDESKYEICGWSV